MNLRYLTLLLLAGSLLTCRTDPKEVPGEDGTPSVEFKRTGSEVSIALQAEPVGFNPILTTQAMARYVNEQIFQTLNDQDPQTFAQVPLLASLPDIREEPDGTVSYAYTIDPAAKWPNGLDVTAQDVVFSLKAMLNPLVEAGPYRPYYANIANIATAPGNEKKFRVITREPYVLTEQAIGSIWVYPEYAYDPEGLLRTVKLTDLTNSATAERLAESSEGLKAFAESFNDSELARDPERIVGSGPYKLTKWEEGQLIRLEAKENYWAKNRNEVWLAQVPEALDFMIITDKTTIGNALRDEAVDAVVGLDVDQFQDFREDDYLSDRYDFQGVPSLTYYGILFNQEDPLVADPKTRRALAYTVNVDQIIEQLFPGLAERVVGPVLPGQTYYHDELAEIPYDPARAAELLAEAGWTDTNGDGTVDKEIDGERRELSFQLLSSPSGTSEAVALVTAEGAAKAGVSIEVVKQEGRALIGALNKGDFTASIYGQAYNPSPDDFTQAWASTSVPPNGTNRGNFNSAEADKIIKQIAGTTDAGQRDPLYRRFQEIMYDDQPMIFLFSPSARIVVSKRLTYEPSSISPNLDFNTMRVRK